MSEKEKNGMTFLNAPLLCMAVAFLFIGLIFGFHAGQNSLSEKYLDTCTRQCDDHDAMVHRSDSLHGCVCTKEVFKPSNSL